MSGSLKLEGISSLSPDHLWEEDDDRRPEQSCEERVGLEAGLEGNFSFAFEGTSPKWGILAGKLYAIHIPPLPQRHPGAKKKLKAGKREGKRAGRGSG